MTRPGEMLRQGLGHIRQAPVFTSPSTSEATNRTFSGLIANSCSLRYHDDTAFGYGKPLSVMVQILTDHGAGCNFNVFVDDGASN